MTVDPMGETPVYRQLAAIMRDQIRSGKLAVGRPLPSLVRLTSEYGVSRGSAAKAQRVLVSEGYARMVPGKGVFVIARRPPKS